MTQRLSDNLGRVQRACFTAAGVGALALANPPPPSNPPLDPIAGAPRPAPARASAATAPGATCA